MKKAFALVVLMVAPTMAFAQGTVSFANNTAGLVIYPGMGGPPVGGAQVELLVAPDGTPLTPLGTYVVQDMVMHFIPNYSTLSGFLAANAGWETINTSSGLPTTGITPVAGRFNGGNVSLPGIAGGANAEYIIIGWTGAFTTYDAALAAGTAMMGTSVLGTTATGNPSTTPPGAPVNLAGTFTGLTLAPVPEPSTFALASLGAAVLMVFRRRRYQQEKAI